MSPAATMSPDLAERSVLAAADELFYSRGIAAVAMSDVRDLAGVSMRRLYNMFPSKADLVAAWLSDRHRSWMAWFNEAVERHAAPDDDALLATFEAIAEWIASPGYRGCGFINSLAETSEIDQRHREIIAGHKRDLLECLAELATHDHPRAPTWLAAAVGVMLDGTFVQCAVFGNDEPLKAARSAVRQLLETTDK